MAIARDAQRLTVLVKTRQGDRELKDHEAKAELAHITRTRRRLRTQAALQARTSALIAGLREATASAPVSNAVKEGMRPDEWPSRLSVRWRRVQR